MGWKWEPYKENDTNPPERGRGLWNKRFTEPFKYSKYIEEAWKVVEKLDKSIIIIKKFKVNQVLYEIIIFDAYSEWTACETNVVEGICHAALLAVGVLGE